MLALRVGRRRTAWESNNIDTIVKNEFQSRGELELEASVYLIEETQTTQAVAEHCASNALGVRGFANIDLLTNRELVESPGETRFAFTRVVHRELRFRDEADLRDYLANQILPTIEARTRVVSKAQIRAYVDERRHASDEEWVTFLTDEGSWP